MTDEEQPAQDDFFTTCKNGFYLLLGIFFSIIFFFNVIDFFNKGPALSLPDDGASYEIQYHQTWLEGQYLRNFPDGYRPLCVRFQLPKDEFFYSGEWFINCVFDEGFRNSVYYIYTDPDNIEGTLYALNGAAQQDSNKFSRSVERLPYELRTDKNFPKFHELSDFSLTLFPLNKLFPN